MDDEGRALLGPQLFDLLLLNVAVIDLDFRVVAANKNFREFFGKWSGKRCSEVCNGVAPIAGPKPYSRMAWYDRRTKPA